MGVLPPPLKGNVWGGGEASVTSSATASYWACFTVAIGVGLVRVAVSIVDRVIIGLVILPVILFARRLNARGATVGVGV